MRRYDVARTPIYARFDETITTGTGGAVNAPMRQTPGRDPWR